MDIFEKEIAKKKNSFIIVNMALLISRFGDSVFDTAIFLYAAHLTIDILGASTTLFSSLVITALFSIVSGYIIDTASSKKVVMLITTMISFLFSFLFLLLLWVESFVPALLFASILGILMALNNFFNGMFQRTIYMYNAELFQQERFIPYQTTVNMIGRIAVIFGVALSGYLYTYFGIRVVILLNSVTFLVPFCIILFHQRKDSTTPSKVSSALTEKSSFRQNIIELIKELRNNRAVRFFTILLCVLNLAYGVIPHIVSVSLMQEFQFSEFFFSNVKSIILIGEIVALTLVLVMRNRYKVSIMIGLFGSLLVFLILPLVSDVLLIYGLFFVYALSDGLTQPLYNSFTHSISEDRRATVFGVIDTLGWMSAAIGISLFTGIQQLFGVLGFFYLALIFFIGLLIYCRGDKHK